ncbi:hypothetical protein AGMMS49983_04280 [Clostridia bacterium]|nr:hypothetical protein AGMMS49983_04280 [Clostridia bacterium]
MNRPLLSLRSRARSPEITAQTITKIARTPISFGKSRRVSVNVRAGAKEKIFFGIPFRKTAVSMQHTAMERIMSNTAFGTLSCAVARSRPGINRKVIARASRKKYIALRAHKATDNLHRVFISLLVSLSKSLERKKPSLLL